jgi:two-component system sensor histidine kinase YesM
MVHNLSRFLRLQLNKGRETLTVSETVGQLQYYLRVQQLRHKHDFHIRHEIADNTKDLPLLKLLLQPLVENAILHGLEKKAGEKELAILAELEPHQGSERLKITVKDNGVGILPDRLKHIRSELAAVTEQNFRLIVKEDANGDDLFGLRNVKARLKLYYGEEAEMTIESVYESGTTVSLYVPIATGGAEAETGEKEGNETQ